MRALPYRSFSDGFVMVVRLWPARITRLISTPTMLTRDIKPVKVSYILAEKALNVSHFVCGLGRCWNLGSRSIMREMKKPESICVFGDSTAWGAWDFEKGGWVSRLWMDVGMRDPDYVEIYNLSISGGTTETILSRFASEARIRKADALLFQTGGNDSSYENSPENYLVPLEQFEKNIEDIISRAKGIAERTAFIGFKNCDESRTTPVSWCNFFYTNENIQRYNLVMKTVCERNDVPFLDVYGILEPSDLMDGLHPNESGHQKIFLEAKSFLTKLGWI